MLILFEQCVKAMRYRKFYEKETGRKLPEDFTIHHVDHDRTHNEIFNLVALPRIVHVKYHMYYPGELTHRHIILPNASEAHMNIESYLIKLAKFQQVWAECLKWINYRNYLLGTECNNYNLHYKAAYERGAK